ncbi:hypothetical protein ACFFJN_13010 [Erwinia mallotivora]|uniref:hypothetical protein n=1 Tax=Erwinia mallotivora TaxID=69222 RepID=UPI0035EC2316
MSNGMLSQAISNIQQLQATINGFSGLPQQAIAIQQSTSALLNDLLPQVQEMQKQVLALGITLQSQLNQQMTILNTQSASQLRAALQQVQTEISPVDGLVNQTIKAGKAANEKIIQDNIELQQIDVSLQNSIAGLQSNLAGANQQLDTLNKQKYYWLALGILGVPGLIAMAVELSKAQDNVNGLQGQVNQIQQQIQSQQGFFTQTQSLSGNFTTLVDKLTGLGSAITFLSRDIGNITHDLDDDVPQQQIQLLFSVALMEVNTLVTDAS